MRWGKCLSVSWFLSIGLLSSGCSSMNFDHLSSIGPEFSFTDYFEGHTRASGWFADRSGNVRRHFCGDFFGEQQGDEFSLVEKLYYSDGIFEERVWIVTISAGGEFRAESDSLVGPATGVQRGSGLQLRYSMNVLVAENKVWNLGMDDYMFYQPDGSLHNSTAVKKWGLRIGNVSTQYQKHDGSQTCSAITDRVSSRTSSLRIVEASN